MAQRTQLLLQLVHRRAIRLPPALSVRPVSIAELGVARLRQLGHGFVRLLLLVVDRVVRVGDVLGQEGRDGLAGRPARRGNGNLVGLVVVLVLEGVVYAAHS